MTHPHLRGLVLVGALVLLTGYLLHAQQPPLQPSSPITTVPGSIAPPAPGSPSQPVVAVTTVPSPAAPQNPLDSVIWGGAVAYMLRYLTKKKWFPVLTPESSSRLKTQIGFVAALATAAGIHIAVNGSFTSADGVGVTLTGFSAHAIKDIGFQWLAQQAWWDTIVKQSTQGATV